MSFNAALELLHQSIISGEPAPSRDLLRPASRLSTDQQLAIYSDAYRLRLQHAVESDYPCLMQHMGKALHPLIRSYIEATPSLTYNLDIYPHAFWRYLRNNRTEPYMADLAELEAAIAVVFMGPGTEALTCDHIRNLDEARLGATCFHLRTPYRLMHFDHDVESAMVANKRGELPTPIPARPTYMMIYRHNNEVQRHVLEENEFHLLETIATEPNFDEALQQMMAGTACGENDIAQGITRWLSRWIQNGYFRLDPKT